MPQGIYPRKSLPRKVEGCGGKRSQGGYCATHAWRVKHWGHPGADIPIQGRLPEHERFWARVDKNGPIPACYPDHGPCWLWQASRGPQGHGQMQWGGRLVAAHRISWMLLAGPILEGLVIDHLCRNPPCVNPDHLEPVTQGENVLRGNAPMGIAARRSTCQAGHEYTPETMYWYTKPNGRRTRRCRICAHQWRPNRLRRLNPS